MSLLVDDSAAPWGFSTPNDTNLTMREAGWHQLADNSSANTDGYYNGTALWTTTPGATVSLVFQGTEIFLYSAKSPDGGQMNVTCDWNSTAVRLDQPVMQTGEMVWHASGLDPTVLHAVRVQMVGGSRINIDHVGVSPGLPSAIPPTVPSPPPPAFRGTKLADSVIPPSTVTSTSIMKMTMTRTMMMTMTATVTPTSTSDISLSKGAAAGIVAGLVAAVLLAGLLFASCCRRSRRNAGQRNDLENRSGLRRLCLPSWIRGRGHSSPRNSEPSFMQIEDKEMCEENMVEANVGKAPMGQSAILPSIKSLSTLSLGQSAIFSSPTPRSILAQFPRPPHYSTSSPSKHHRDRSMAMSLSINTDVGSAREKLYVGTVRSSRGGSFTHDQTVRSIRTQRQTSDGFSASDLSEEWYLSEEWHEVNFQKELQNNEEEADDAVYYAEQFSSRPHHAQSDDQSDEQMGNLVDEPDDMNPDTPLLIHSPAVASSNGSFVHHDSQQSHASRHSKGNKILRSLRSHSSKRSSLRHSVGKLSRRSSMARTPDARTPISKTSSSTNTSGSPSSERRTGRFSTLSGLSVPVLVPEMSEISQDVPPMPGIGVHGTASLSPPSAWPGALASASRRASGQLLRAHRPAGPRARRTSDASISSKASSSSRSAHSRAPSQNEREEMLSVVEEASRTGSVRHFPEDDCNLETSGLLYD